MSTVKLLKRGHDTHAKEYIERYHKYVLLLWIDIWTQHIFYPWKYICGLLKIHGDTVAVFCDGYM